MAVELDLYRKCCRYLERLCVDISERAVGSAGNREATDFFEQTIASFQWGTESTEFAALDWLDGGARLEVGGELFDVLVSPYSVGCAVESALVGISSTDELEQVDCRGKIIFLHGAIAREQLMPKNFVFYNPEEHRQIIALLESSGAEALVCATGRNPGTSGGVYPFPLIEDGDFDIPSVYMTEEEGARLKPYIGRQAALYSRSERVNGKGCNVVGRKGSGAERIVVTAHIDARKGLPGAIDNATGVVVLLLLAQLLQDYSGSRQLELVAFNGEDYYAVPGQMSYIAANRERFDTIILNINIDGVGYRVGKTAFSFFDLPEELREKIDAILEEYPGIAEGEPWPQGDHSIFIQQGRPAVAVTSKWLIDNMAGQTITHTAQDNIEIVDCRKVVEAAEALAAFITII